MAYTLLQAIILFIIKFAKGIIKKGVKIHSLWYTEKKPQAGNSVSLWITHRGFQSIAQ